MSESGPPQTGAEPPTSALDRHVGTVIRHHRQRQGLDLDELGRRVACPPDVVDAIERGVTRPSPVVLARIGGVLGLSVGQFFLGAEAVRWSAERQAPTAHPATTRQKP